MRPQERLANQGLADVKLTSEGSLTDPTTRRDGLVGAHVADRLKDDLSRCSVWWIKVLLALEAAGAFATRSRVPTHVALHYSS
jgi:hypothetical protein